MPDKASSSQSPYWLDDIWTDLPTRVYLVISISMIATAGVTIGLYFLDLHLIDGMVSVWAKPLKVQIALAVSATNTPPFLL